jgi:hypothetical protein
MTGSVWRMATALTGWAHSATTEPPTRQIEKRSVPEIRPYAMTGISNSFGSRAPASLRSGRPKPTCPPHVRPAS